MEEFIFDDDVDDVGQEVEAHCPKCRTDTTHVIISKYEDEIRRVQCNPCGDVHAYRKPRGEGTEEEAPPEKEPPKKRVKAKPTYEQVMAKQKKPPRAYAIAEYFKEPEVLSHPKFGVGFVSENIGNDKIEVTFQDEKRVLIHNRKNLSLPFLRPASQPRAKKPAKAGKAETKKSGAARPAAKKPVKKAAVKKPVKKAVAKKAAKKPVSRSKGAAARPAAKKPVKKASLKKVAKKRR